MGSRPEHCSQKAGSLQQHRARSGQASRVMHARIFQPRKKPHGPPKRSAAAATNLGQAFKPVATFVVARTAFAAPWRLPAAKANEPPLPCRADCRRNLEGPSPFASLRPRADFYLWHSPTLANLKHLADRRGRAHYARTTAPDTGSKSPASRELPSLAVSINSQVTLVSSITCGFA